MTEGKENPKPKETSRQYWERRVGRALSDYELKEIEANLTGFFTTLYKADKRLRDEAAAGGREWPPMNPIANPAPVAPKLEKVAKPIKFVEKLKGKKRTSQRVPSVAPASATVHSRDLIEQGRKILESKPGRDLTDSEIEESLNNLAGLLELRMKWDQEKKAGDSKVPKND